MDITENESSMERTFLGANSLENESSREWKG